MKTIKLILTLVCLLVFTTAGFAQTAADKPDQGILGYLDPLTGVFHTIPHPEVGPDAAATAATTGKFVYSFTITISSTIPTTAKIFCQGNASVLESTTFFTATEIAGVTATRSGSTATCTVNIPYSWKLTTPTKDTVSLSFSVTAGTPTASPYRFSQQSIATIPVPASGTTTTETLTPTI